MAATRAAKLKNPRGGLTAAGRKHFKQAEGANLKPGVKRVRGPEDMKRKGSFLRRHYGKKTTSPLRDDHGEPTRYAKQAHAWGEPVPKTQADVKKLARKGEQLLERYRRAKADGESGAKSSRGKPSGRASGGRSSGGRSSRGRAARASK